MAKTFYRSSLPESIRYNKGVYKPNKAATKQYKGGREGHLIIWEYTPYVIVEVLHRRLRGVNDIHGNPYKPTVWIFTKEKEAANG
jgi:hypothetical protein